MLLLTVLLSCTIPVEQRAACASFVTCVSARDARDGTSTDVLRYTPSGDCWGGDAIADLCERSCQAGLSFLAEREPDLGEACAP